MFPLPHFTLRLQGLQMFTKFAFYLLLNYTNMLNCRSILIATNKSGNQAMNTYDRIYALKYLLFCSLGVRTPFLFTRTFLFCLWFIYLYSYNMAFNFCNLETV
jgi:hypothetical protein